MHRQKLVLAAVMAGLLGAGNVAQADTAVALRGGTLGLGAELDFPVGKNWVARLGYSAFSRTETVDDTDATYDGDLKLGNASATMDWHPGGHSFFLSGGLVATSNRIDVTGVPTGGSYEIGDHTYTASQIGSLRGRIKVGNSTAPYIGIGLGHPFNEGSRFSILFDLGVMLTGSPDVTLTAVCGASVPAPTCTQIQADVQREIVEIEDDATQLKVWPVLNFSFAYRF